MMWTCNIMSAVVGQGRGRGQFLCCIMISNIGHISSYRSKVGWVTGKQQHFVSFSSPKHHNHTFLPYYHHFTPTLLSLYPHITLTPTLHFTPTLLSLYTHITVILLPHYYHFTPTLLSLYSHITVTLLPHYCHFTPTLLTFYSHVTITVLWHYWHFTPTLLAL